MRATLLFGLAGLAGLTGAGIVGSQRQDATALYGALKPVVITRGALDESLTISPNIAKRRLSVVRVPARFAPTGAISSPAQAIGLKPLGRLPAGLYLSAALLRSPQPTEGRPTVPQLSSGRRPVEIVVSGASAITFARGSGRVDVVVTSEAGPGGTGRTYVAARAVPLLELVPEEEVGPGKAMAVLGLRRSQALHLIEAETYARDIRLLPDLTP